MKRFAPLFILSFCVSLCAFAQDLSGIEVKPTNDKGPKVDVDLGIKPADPDTSVVQLPSEWARFAGGVWMGFVGQGTFGTFPRFSADKAFSGAREKGFGVGLQVDVGVKHSLSQALRFRVGYLDLGVSPDATTLKTYSRDDLEAKAKLFHFLVMYRWAWRSFDDLGIVWFGAGAAFNYVANTVSASASVDPQSKLRNSMGVGYQVTAGWDYPVLKYTDLGVELAYHPFKSVSALLSLRTSL